MPRCLVWLSCCLFWAAGAVGQISPAPQEPVPAAQSANAVADERKVARDSEKPLPKMEDLIARVKAHQAASEEVRKNYTVKQTVVADEFDSHGNKKGSHTDEYQMWTVTHSDGENHLYVTISQHIGRDGKPLPDDQARKEQERVDKEVAAVKDGKYKQHNDGLALSVSNLLKVATFSNERRATVDGRTTIEFDYTGDPKAKASDMGQDVMKKLSGELWIDEEDAAVRRVTGKLKENFHVGGGLLVNVKAGSWFDLSTVRVNNEIWFIRTLQAHADGRFLLFKGFDGDANIAFSDYRRMKTSVTILPGSQVIGEDGKPIPNLQVEPADASQVKPAGAPKP